MSSGIAQRVQIKYAEIQSEIVALEAQLKEKRAIARFLESMIGGDGGKTASKAKSKKTAATPKKSEKRRRPRGSMTIRDGVIKVLSDAGGPLGTSEIRDQFPMIGVNGSMASLYAQISLLKKENVVVAVAKPGRGDAYSLVDGADQTSKPKQKRDKRKASAKKGKTKKKTQPKAKADAGKGNEAS
jgi:hypothetical protein